MNSPREIKHAAECPHCGSKTYAFEKFCVECERNRWLHVR